MGKLTINGAVCTSKLLVYRRVYPADGLADLGLKECEKARDFAVINQDVPLVLFDIAVTIFNFGKSTINGHVQ